MIQRIEYRVRRWFGLGLLEALLMALLLLVAGVIVIGLLQPVL